LQLGLAAVTEANRGDFTVKLKSKRDRGVEEIIADVRAKVKKQEPTLDVEFVQLLQDMIGDLTSAPEPVVIKMFSQNPELLREWGPGRRPPRRWSSTIGLIRSVFATPKARALQWKPSGTRC
jgi:multidrug efflux pump subunit AcrB